ncbi:FRA10AC1, partial [Symbiodinium pilosum]
VVTAMPEPAAPAVPAMAKPEVKTVPLGTHKMPVQSSTAAAKRPGPRALPQPKPAPPVLASPPPPKAEAKLPPPSVTKAAEPRAGRRRPAEEPVQVLPAKRIFDWTLLAKIDSLLLGAESSFFLHRQGDGIRLPGYEPENCESSGSEDQEEDACESEESEESDAAKILGAPGPADADMQEDEEFEEEEEEEIEEDDVVEEVDKSDAMAAVVATTRPKAKMPPPPPSGEVSEPKAPSLSTRAKPPPLPRERLPKLSERREEDEEEEPPAPALEAPEGSKEDEEGVHEEDEDFNDEEMMATFAAKLQEPSEAAAPPLDARRRPLASRNEQDFDGKPANIATRAKAKPKPKAWGLPPPLSGKKKAKEPPQAEAKPPREPEAEPRPPEEEQPPPPFFDQWLASLKFVAGWNDQKKYQASEVKEAFSEYLAAEDIISKTTVEQLCRTIVPLLLDLERVDTMVVANLRTEVLRTLKIVQVCILRIVTFEMLREKSAKAEAAKKKGKGKKAQGEVPPEGAAYLASDITSLAKVIQHFRFDQNFTKGVHQLIVAFRKQKAETPRPEKGPAAKAQPRKKPRSETEAPEKAEVPDKAEKTEKAEEAEKAAEGGEKPPTATEEDNADQDGEGEAGGEPARKKPRLVS